MPLLLRLEEINGWTKFSSNTYVSETFAELILNFLFEQNSWFLQVQITSIKNKKDMHMCQSNTIAKAS